MSLILACAFGQESDNSYSITTIGYSSNGQLYTGTSSGLVQSWVLPVAGKPQSWDVKCQESVHAHDEGVEFLEVMAGSKRESLVTIGVAGDVKLWDIYPEGLDHLKTIYGYHSIMHPLVVSNRSIVGEADNSKSAGDRKVPKPEALTTTDHRYLVFATEDGAINTWNLDDYSTVNSLIDHISLITAMDVDTTGLILVTGMADGVVKIWDLATLQGAVVAHVEGHVTHVAFAPASGERSGTTLPEHNLLIASSNGTQSFISVMHYQDKPYSPVYKGTSPREIQGVAAVDSSKYVITYRDSSIGILETKTASGWHERPDANRMRPSGQVTSSRAIALNNQGEFFFACGYANTKIALLGGFEQGYLPYRQTIKKPWVTVAIGSHADISLHGMTEMATDEAAKSGSFLANLIET
jgi:WD40 repeat protein